MKIVPVSASPTVPPTCWNSVRLLVPVPRSRTGTLFWTTSVNTANAGPMPKPMIAIHSHSRGSGVSGRMLVDRYRPSASRIIPTTTTTLYCRVRATIWPLAIAERIKPARSGRIW